MKTKKSGPMILNGTRVWLSAILFLIAQTSAGIWWASSINTSVKSVKEDVRDLKLAIENNRKEAKADMQNLQNNKKFWR